MRQARICDLPARSDSDTSKGLVDAAVKYATRHNVSYDDGLRAVRPRVLGGILSRRVESYAASETTPAQADAAVKYASKHSLSYADALKHVQRYDAVPIDSSVFRGPESRDSFAAPTTLEETTAACRYATQFGVDYETALAAIRKGPLPRPLDSAPVRREWLMRLAPFAASGGLRATLPGGQELQLVGGRLFLFRAGTPSVPIPNVGELRRVWREKTGAELPEPS